jgi:SNF2 family DNA or RNA helicase
MSTDQFLSLASGIRDNYRRGAVGDFLKARIKPDASLSVVSAYFTMYAYAALQQQLDSIAGLRFLYGDPRSVKSVNPDRQPGQAVGITDEGLRLRDQLQQKRLARECAEWLTAKAEIRSVKRVGFLHGKLYHIARGEVEDAIVGSSNFTVRGLGLGENGNNIELNLVVDSGRERRELKAWFDEIWNDDTLVDDVKDQVLERLAQLYRDNAPEFIYYKTLYHIFEQYLSDQRTSGLLDERTRITETGIWRSLFEFQKDGVKGAINKIQRHNGCIIADSVGLGKTFEALAVIKYFELLNYKVLVLCPKKLRENWTVYQAQNNSPLNPFVNDRFAFTVLCHTDLSREGGRSGDIDLATINWGNYDLVVVDESHNFRNNTKGRRDETGQVVHMSRYERLMEGIIKAGIRTRVLLLSATPVNNSLSDLRNQIYFLTEGEDGAFAETLGVPSLKNTLDAAQARFAEWAKQSQNRNAEDLLQRLSSAFFTLLDELTIARSRKHIQRYYRDSIDQLGGFPQRELPVSVHSAIDLAGEFMPYDRINDEIDRYQLALFNPSRYIREEFRPLYVRERVAVFTQEKRESLLIGMMKVNFMKRLESSVNSFAVTLGRTIAKIEELEARIARFEALADADGEIDFDALELPEEEDEELRDAFEIGKARIRLAHLRLDAWRADLALDRAQLRGLLDVAAKVTAARDAKLDRLKQLVAGKIAAPTTARDGRPNRKVLVFTAFADTARYLYQNLREWAVQEQGINIALVTGGTDGTATTYGRNAFNEILTHFSPRSKQRAAVKAMRQDGEIDLLIGTDCISEGQNLQDCDTVINYDIHWNPVRIIQRFGRIDRIGSINPAVRLINFWPTEDLNKYINLKNRVEARMALVDITATNEDNLLRPEDLQDVVTADLRYRDRQLLKMRDEILDLEDFNENVTLSDFTLDDFRVDLMRYIEANRQALQDAPLGLYGVVPPRPDIPQIRPGVIFCLRQGDGGATAEVNPLQPYFLVYVYDDRVIAYTFAQPKQILEIFRALCADQTNAYEELCRLFDRQTATGADLEPYSRLLEAAVKSIERTYRKRAAAKLGEGRGGLLPTREEQVTAKTDFELVTWLIVADALGAGLPA